MNSAGLPVPDDPLGFIRDCIKAGRIYWTYHVNMRIRERSIPRKRIVGVIESYEIIESYPDDKYLPSYLVWARSGDTIIHVLFAVDIDANHVRVVTAYRPDPSEWSGNMKRRKAV